ncbi:MAG: S8 family serine peptidase [Gammaproteobacteria bacterium]
MKPAMQKYFWICCALFALPLISCGGGGGGGGLNPPEPQLPPPSQLPNGYLQTPFMTVTLTAPDNIGYTPDAEFNAHHGLAAINADAAYRGGYFGQSTTIAVVELGFDPGHADLSANIIVDEKYLFDVPPADLCERGFNGNIEAATGNIHGTYVALLAAGVRGGEGGGFVGVGTGCMTDSNANLKDTHGVAPEAKIIALRNPGSSTTVVIAPLLEAPVPQVINNSYGFAFGRWLTHKEHGGAWLWGGDGIPYFAPLLLSVELSQGLQEEFGVVGKMFTDKDTVMVWSSGNDNWHSGGRINLCGKNYSAEDKCELSNTLAGRKFDDAGDSQFSVEDIVENFEILHITENRETGVATTMTVADLSEIWEDGMEDYNDPGGWAHAPIIAPDLIGKWLVVGSVDEDNEISDFSNGCGIAKNWCMVAPGENLDILENIQPRNGTSFSAPIASGALAVLKSRMPDMPMEVVLAAMLTSATPLGSRISDHSTPDDIYGWGLVNLENAINLQGEITLTNPVAISNEDDAPGALLSAAAVRLPSHFSAAAGRLQTIKIAAGGIGGAYFNMPLSGIATIETAPQNWGEAAKDMLRPPRAFRITAGALFAAADAKTNRFHYAGAAFSAGALGGWVFRHAFCRDCEEPARREWNVFNALNSANASAAALPFFARGEKSYMLQMRGEGLRPFAAFGESGGGGFRQYGMRWQKNISGFDALAEVSQSGETGGLLGADFGAPGYAKTKTNQMRVFLRGGITPDILAFAGYETARAKTRAGGGLLQGADGLRAEGWSAGAEIKNIFGGKLRFGARQKTRILRGRARLRYLAAGDNFAEAFYLGEAQELTETEAEINLSSKSAPVISLGYAPPESFSGVQWSAGAEHDTASGASAISAQLEINF